MKKVLALAILLPFLFSCKKDKEQDDKRTAFEFVVSNDYILENYEYWVVISDNSNVLYTQNIQNGQTYKSPEISAPLVDVHIYRYYWTSNQKDLYITSYTDIEPTEWVFSRLPSVTSLGTATIQVSDLQNVKGFTLSSSLSTWEFLSATTTPRTLNLYQNPGKVLISYWPSDNSALRYIFNQNVTDGQSIVYTMSDFPQATDAQTYSIQNGYSSISFRYAGYNSDFASERYYFARLNFQYSESSLLTLYFPSIFPNYYLSYLIVDDVDNTRSMNYINYGTRPSTIPTASYPSINVVNHNSIDNISTTIENPNNFHMLTHYFTKNQTVEGVMERFTWLIRSSSKSNVSNATPDIPSALKGKSTFFDKSNALYRYSYLVKHTKGEVVSYNDYITKLVSRSAVFNEKITEYTMYIKYPSSAKGGEVNHTDEMLETISNQHEWDMNR